MSANDTKNEVVEEPVAKRVKHMEYPRFKSIPPECTYENIQMKERHKAINIAEKIWSAICTKLGENDVDFPVCVIMEDHMPLAKQDDLNMKSDIKDILIFNARCEMNNVTGYKFGFLFKSKTEFVCAPEKMRYDAVSWILQAKDDKSQDK